MVSAGDSEAFVTANGIAIAGRRSFLGTRTIFFHDPERNVPDLAGSGPSAAALIAGHVHEGDGGHRRGLVL